MEPYVAKGYEPVRETFEAGVSELGDGGGAFCAYVGGVRVVDVWGGVAAPGRPWQADNRAVLMSLTKGLTTMCVQVLVDRGLLDVELPVSTWWPEFSAKEVLLRHVLTHTSGLLGFPGQERLLSLDGTGWDDYDAITGGLAAAEPSWEPGTRHGYHALTYGWLLGEIVHRVSGRRVGAFFREEIAAPLGLDTAIGTPAAERHLVAPIHQFSLDGLPQQAKDLYAVRQAAMRDPDTLAGWALAATGGRTFLDDVDTFFNNPRVLGTEIPSTNGTSTARSIARLFALLAEGGSLDGVRLLSRDTVDAFAEFLPRVPEASGDDDGPAVPRTLGYIGNFAGRYGPTTSAYGAEGGGGELGVCDPANGVSFGFVRSHLALSGAFSAQLINTLYHCTP